MEPAPPLAGQGHYPEREDAPEPVVDRWMAALGFRFRNAFQRAARDPAGLASDVGQYATRFANEPLAPHLSALRYRLRRDGLRADLIAQCFGLCHAAMSSSGSALAPAPEILTAATVLLQGGIAELADPDARRQALAHAALVRAIEGVPAHVITSGDAGARRAAETLQGPLAALGMETGCIAQAMDPRARRVAYAAPVVCGAQREIAIDYLRDRLQFGVKLRPLAGSIGRLSAGAAGARLLLRGLHCALVDDADAVLLDDASQPLAIAAEADHAAERLLYEQALELARALESGADFEQRDDGARLTEAGAQRVARLVGTLGGVWAARQRREELIALALDVLHRLRAGADYRVEQGRVALLGQDEAAPGEATDTEQSLQHLIEVKEGCRLSVRRDVLVRLSVPRFLRRYLRLSGLCADARGVERELWSMYSLPTTRVGPLPLPVNCVPRVFLTAADKRGALVAGVRSAAASGRSALIAVRTPAEAQAVAAALDAAGLRAGRVPGTGEAAEREAIAGLDTAGGVVLALYPADRRSERAGAGRVRLFVAELHDTRRHVARLARVFAAEACEMLLSLEDEAVARQVAPALLAVARLGSAARGELSPARSRWLARLAQRGSERLCTVVRQDVMSRDQYLEELLAFSGKRE